MSDDLLERKIILLLGVIYFLEDYARMFILLLICYLCIVLLNDFLVGLRLLLKVEN